MAGWTPVTIFVNPADSNCPGMIVAIYQEVAMEGMQGLLVNR